MLPGERDDTGALYVTTTAPSNIVYEGGFQVGIGGALYVKEGTGTQFIGGHMTDQGRLCIAFGGVVANHVNGLPVTADGRLVCQLNQPPSPGDSNVGRIRVGPLGGVYANNLTPVVIGPFSSGFSEGFQ